MKFVGNVRRLARGMLVFGAGYAASAAVAIALRRPARIRRPWGVAHVRPWNSDVTVYRQVFQNREYDTAEYPQHLRIRSRYEDILARGLRPLIIDAGANAGFSSIWFALEYEKARVVAIEPEPDNARIWRMNVPAALDVHLVEAALGGSGGSVAVHPAPMAWGTQVTRTPEGGCRVVTVDDVMAQNPGCELFIVKIDIEGFEADVFEHGAPWAERTPVVMIEPHDWMPGASGSSRSFRAALTHKTDMLVRGENLIFVD